MTHDAATIARKLRAKGVELREPASAEELKQFEHDMGLTLDPFFRSLYSQFNGFMSADGDNSIELWPLERIQQEREESLEKGGERYFAFGDVMINAYYLMCCLARETAPIFYGGVEIEEAPTASKFFAKFIAGDYDF